MFGDIDPCRRWCRSSWRRDSKTQSPHLQTFCIQRAHEETLPQDPGTISIYLTIRRVFIGGGGIEWISKLRKAGRSCDKDVNWYLVALFCCEAGCIFAQVRSPLASRSYIYQRPPSPTDWPIALPSSYIYPTTSAFLFSPSQHYLSSKFFTPLKFDPNLHGFGSAMIVTDSQSFALSLKIPRVSTLLFPYLPLQFKANSFLQMSRPWKGQTLPTKLHCQRRNHFKWK
jgi:hypothetical protein